MVKGNRVKMGTLGAVFLGVIALMATEFVDADETPTGHANVGECAWGKCCGAEADGSPNNYCRWVAGVDCCDSGHGKLAKHGTQSGDAANGWDYDCSANDCPGDDDCKAEEAEPHSVSAYN